MNWDHVPLYKRVKLFDGREGCIYGMVYKGEDPPLKVDVMLDNYVRVTCRHDQLEAVTRKGKTVDYKTGGEKVKIYPIEVANFDKLHGAIWHAHYSRFPPKSVYSPYRESYLAGEVIPLPAHENLEKMEYRCQFQPTLF